MALHRRKFGTALWMSVLFASALAVVGEDGPARAAGASCDMPFGNYLEGASSLGSSNVRGVTADIETNVPELCSANGGSPSISTAWVMLTPASSLQQWAQTGYIKVGAASGFSQLDPGFHYMTQYTLNCGGCYSPQVVTRTWGDPGTATHSYNVGYSPQDNRIHMYIDSVSQAVMNRNVLSEWDPSWEGQFAGETYNRYSDIPGTPTDRTRYNYILKYDLSGSSQWITNFGADIHDADRYHHSTGPADVGGKWLDIWTYQS